MLHGSRKQSNERCSLSSEDHFTGALMVFHSDSNGMAAGAGTNNFGALAMNGV